MPMLFAGTTIVDPAEVDLVIPLATELGTFNQNFSWSGKYPAVEISGTGTYRIRIASDEATGRFYRQSSTGLVEVSLNLYVPDSRVPEYIDKGLHPIPFSQVGDWSWETMLGAQPTDTVAMYVGDISLGQGEKIFFEMSGRYTPANIYLAWRKK